MKFIDLYVFGDEWRLSPPIVLPIIPDQQIQRLLVLLYGGEPAGGLEELVVEMIVVDSADLAHEHRAAARYADERVVETGGEGNGLARLKHQFLARRERPTDTVHAHLNCRIGEGIVIGRIPELEFEPAAAAVDDVLHLVEMVVDGGDLAFADDHDLLGVGLAFTRVALFGGAIPDGEQEEAVAIEVSAAEIGDVPPELGVHDLPDFRALRTPVIGRPGGERRQFEVHLVEEHHAFPHDGIDLGSFHGLSRAEGDRYV